MLGVVGGVEVVCVVVGGVEVVCVVVGGVEVVCVVVCGVEVVFVVVVVYLKRLRMVLRCAKAGYGRRTSSS